MDRTIRTALNNKKQGFYIDQRLILPFKCQIVKLIIGGEIHTEFVGGKDIKLNQDPLNTSIYFRSAGKLTTFLGTYKVIKLIVVEQDKCLCEIENHIKLICEIEEYHHVNIHEPGEDMLFIE